jgi:two-component system, OmpR family, phosphate regulon sensor histidine kinase PhoR
MNRTTFRWVTALGVFCILGIILMQIYWVRKAFDLKEKQLQQNIHLALHNVSEKIAAHSKVILPEESPVKQLQSDYFVVNINTTVYPAILEHYLKKEFLRFDLPLDYEYKIFDCNSNEMVYGKFISADPARISSHKRSHFPKWDEYTYYFGISFPGLSGEIMESMDIWIFSSFILLVVVLFFGYSLTAILRQKKLSEFQKDFVNNMTHEFKTPLSTISIATNVLAKPGIEKDTTTLQTYVSIIASENARIISLLEKVLQIASLEKEEIKLNKEKVDLHDLIKRVTSHAELNLKAKQGTITLQLCTSTPMLHADVLHLTNILFNLIDNAIKYSSEAPNIRICTQTSKDVIKVDICDSGVGIKKEYHQKIFDKFFRVPTGNVHNVKGFGLGLHYVHQLVKRHKWKIELESIENKGSTFTLYIPVK